ncbi:hypothetical protein ACFLTP_07540 [Chloroflexota bacterium]
MGENDFNKQINKITRQAVQGRREELAKKKGKAGEKQPIIEAENIASPKHNEQESTYYTAVLMVKLEYNGGKTPTKEQLAEDLGQTIIKWVGHKEFYAISPGESVPKLASIDVDVQ